MDQPTFARHLQARALAELRYFLTALGYFTRVPVPRWVGFEPHYLNAAARYFPLVGALLGAIAALVYLAALSFFPAGVAVLLSMAVTLLATGALHEDGLADCCDGFGGGYTRDDILRIMRDPHIGVFGTLALIVALALKWQTLVALPPARAAWIMVAGHAASRALAISYLSSHDYVRAEGKAKPVASQSLGPRSGLLVAVVGLPWLFWPDWQRGAATLVVLLMLRQLLGYWFHKRLGGYTGDCLGFAQQIFELAIYLSALAWI
jgi:adenosylcobinamide-GDP ribazoletransferase